MVLSEAMPGDYHSLHGGCAAVTETDQCRGRANSAQTDINGAQSF